MANRKRDAGREALEKKGWWRSHRWLVLRRLCQFFVLGMFLSGPWFGVWILHGNYSSSLLFDTVPLTDPLMTLQSLASGHLPATVALTGALCSTSCLTGKRCGDYHRALRPGGKAIILQLGLPAEPDYRLSELVTQAL